MMSDRIDLSLEVILVTGAAGSIGRELGLNFASKNPEQLILVDISETGLFNLIEELQVNHPKTNFIYFTESICNPEFLNFLFQNYKITSVFHAAAYKHVSLTEQNVCAAITTNIYGAKLLIDKATTAGVRRFIFISTDKAVDPVSVMGRTKKVVEDYLVFKQIENNHIQICTLRLCNVYGSSGSVVPVFKNRIASNLPLEIKGQNIKRAFITVDVINQIADWLLVVEDCTGIFIPKNPKVFTILEIAHQVLKETGVTSVEEYPVQFIHLPNFEKQEESLKNTSEKAIQIESSELIQIEKKKAQHFNIELLEACLLAAKSYKRDEVQSLLNKLCY
ncbi:polysaccharide biosynthesis protein [Leeuwenhoekiella marinoflava]|uniref:polysaccharide biosynthesis protein n=1 Tax=Leeuwenhoekiella marinoflava TaxID=988 RepID=UPI0030036ADC